jgi:hypothetical protein
VPDSVLGMKGSVDIGTVGAIGVYRADTKGIQRAILSVL